MNKDVENNIYIRGKWGNIEYAINKNGGMPAKEYIEAMDTRERIKIETLLKRMADEGRIYGEGRFRKIKGTNSIFEFKSGRHRLFCFNSGKSWILTNGFIKQKMKTPKIDIARAEKIRKEHIG